jgi:ribosomal protein S18 acetylase RimI-like enzyme
VFASPELARRIERAERDLIAGATLAVARSAGADATFCMPLAGGVAAFSGVESPMTKIAGLGFDGAPGDDELARIEALYAARGAAVQVELSTLAASGIAACLSMRGYALVGFESVLARALVLGETRPPRADVTVERVDAEGFEPWLQVVVSAFAAPDAQGVAAHQQHSTAALEPVIRAVAGASGMACYVARRGSVTAGGASMRLADGLAQLCGAGTLPAHRRRGVQGALLERRLTDAASAGCDLAVVTTSPGSRSQENVERQGFELLYTRAILRRGA